MHKTFQVLLIAFLIIFTTAGMVLFIGPLTSLFWPTNTNGISGGGGGVSVRAFNVVVGVIVLIMILAIYLISRRTKLR